MGSALLEHIEKEIRIIAKHQFPADQVEQFIATFQQLLSADTPRDYLLQISTDEGKELELGFFTSDRIVDVTLSNQKVHFYSYPLSTIRHIAITESTLKSTLTIQGEKKFDYNVVKPASTLNLEKYQHSLRNFIE